MKERTWFDQGADAIAAHFRGERFYVCPLCLGRFDETLLDELTVEHVPPETLGGQRLVLTCERCNQHASGRDGVDTHAATEQKRSDYSRGISNKYHPVRLRLGDASMRAEANTAGGVIIRGVPKASSQTDRDAIIAQLEKWATGEAKPEFHLELDRYRYSPIHAQTAWLRAAYLAAFAKFGYTYILRDVLSPVREQIFNPESKLLEGFRITIPTADEAARSIGLISEPAWVNGLAIQIGRHVLLLPIADDDLSFFERVRVHAAEGKDITLRGTVPWGPWPRRPEYLWDNLGGTATGLFSPIAS